MKRSSSVSSNRFPDAVRMTLLCRTPASNGVGPLKNHGSIRRGLAPLWGSIAVCALGFWGSGCETLQQKFVRKSKTTKRDSPIILFEDYTSTQTPLDRYRKHYAMFDYWNAQLLDELSAREVNTKRVHQASVEALKELQSLKAMLSDELQGTAGQFIRDRGRFDLAIQRGDAASSQRDWLRRDVEAQTRQIHRTLFWRKVEDHLDLAPASPSDPTDSFQHAPTH